MRIQVPLRHATRLLNHGPTVLVTSKAEGRANVMAAAWVMAVDFDPPKVAAVIAAGTYTRELVERSGAFALNLPTVAMAGVTHAVGSASGREEDKFARHGLATFPGSTVDVPLVLGCAAWLECRVVPEPSIRERYDLFIAEVVAAWADDAVFSAGRWRFGDLATRTIHHVAGGAFFATGEIVGSERRRDA